MQNSPFHRARILIASGLAALSSAFSPGPVYPTHRYVPSKHAGRHGKIYPHPHKDGSKAKRKGISTCPRGYDAGWQMSGQRAGAQLNRK